MKVEVDFMYCWPRIFL